MNYQDTINWMFQQLPMYQNKGKAAYKEDLSNTLILAKHLNNPERRFKSIHVAGTNGKGSTSHLLASVLQEAGYKVGLYTSPHLKDFRERIRINGKVISKQFVIGFIKRNKSFFEANHLSFFEMTVGMAFDYFAKQEVDIAVIEVGLGGRLDSTNIIIPELSIITNIGLDHMQFLGNTIEKIAVEKAGIIKGNIPVVIGQTQKETQSVFKEKARLNNSKIYFTDQLVDNAYECDLKGSYQKHNIKTVMQSVYVLRQSKFKVSENELKKGLLKVVENTGLMGRWQVLQQSPKVICDTAHNKEGLSYVMEQLQSEYFNQLHIVFGVVNDKNLDSIIPLLPKEATYYFCKPNISRGLDANILKEEFNKNNLKGNAYVSVNQAYADAKSKVKKGDLIYVGGSTFVVAEII
ncbi:folylpolyglutamate synthase/dihydrofolate synthase family protein [Winogradskyella sp.]|jgi:dihydrofolate synthase/folylpolyglutamate synthase|uniref:bifunctional folylpolyglutamate synthase/dihydrofolate synthase n=1 Tax=Winogradskyella sp. TaxID=1883156 RepID=UPI0025EB66E1|nr:folylpolyglutamate synthase/dihydrofolate synthase family protein [Winogradskyella sp.]MCT4630272.1 bifunctional folylpolyglutamate synthase/dihydrofolate synthase [Winogradskyella sp.]